MSNNAEVRVVGGNFCAYAISDSNISCDVQWVVDDSHLPTAGSVGPTAVGCAIC